MGPPQPIEYTLALALPRQVRCIVRGIVRVSFRQQYRPPYQSPLLEVTFQMAVLFYRCALREGSAKQAFCQRFKLACRGYHREVASKRSSRVDSWQRYCFIAVPCGKTPQNMRFAQLHPSLKMLSPRGREFFLSLSHVLGLVCPRDFGSGLSS